MSSQPYFLISKTSNIVENIVSWDGDTSVWNPPSEYIALPKETTLSKVWRLNTETRAYDLVTVDGQGDIGFTWNGTELMTNEAQPEPLQPFVGNS